MSIVNRALDDEPEPRLDSFDEARQLNQVALRNLLRRGDPPERIWAAWALALEGQPQDQNRIVRHCRDDEHAGVRRQMLVVLAGLGQADVLAERLQHDPDPRVRATAAQYLARLTAADGDELHRLLADRLQHDPAPSVRAAVAAHVPSDAPTFVEQHLADALSDPDPEVRAAAADGLAARAGERLASLVPRRLSVEPEWHLRRQLLELWAHAEGADGLLDRIDEHSDAIVAEALHAIARRGDRPDWRQLAPLSKRRSWSVQSALAELMQDRLAAVPTDWLVDFMFELSHDPHAVIAPEHSSSDRLWRGLLHSAAARLRGRSPESLGSRERETLQRLRAVARDWIRAGLHLPRPEPTRSTSLRRYPLVRLTGGDGGGERGTA
jgi:HEAT repeat protein